MARQQKVLMEESDRAQRTKNIHGHPALWSSRTIFVTTCNVCVYISICLYVYVCVLVIVPEPWGHQNIPYGELWSAPLCRLHFPVQPNLSQRTKSCQIRADSYRSISSSQTCQLHGGRDYARGEGDSPISRLWGSLWLIRAALMSLYQCISVDSRHSKKHIYTVVFSSVCSQTATDFESGGRHISPYTFVLKMYLENIFSTSSITI